MEKLLKVLRTTALFILTAAITFTAEYNLKMGMVAGTASNEYKSAEFFANKVKERTKGKVEIALYPNGQLGDDRSMLEQIISGDLDFTFTEIGRFSIFYPEAEVYVLPYMIKDFSHIQRAVFQTELGKNLVEKIQNELGIIILSQAYNGTRQTTSSKPINSIDDMKGLKIRVPNALSNLNFVKYSGAIPVPMSFSEVYVALRDGYVNGQENPLSAVRAQKFYEVQPYLALTNHILNDQLYVVRSEVIKNLPREFQEAIKESAEEAAVYHTKLFTDEEESLKEFFKENGMKITEPDLNGFEKAMEPIYEEFINKTGEIGKKAVEEIKESK